MVPLGYKLVPEDKFERKVSAYHDRDEDDFRPTYRIPTIDDSDDLTAIRNKYKKASLEASADTYYPASGRQIRKKNFQEEFESNYDYSNINDLSYQPDRTASNSNKRNYRNSHDSKVVDSLFHRPSSNLRESRQLSRLSSEISTLPVDQPICHKYRTVPNMVELSRMTRSQL